MKNPSYFSILTANVRYDKDLKPNAKLLYSEISALSNKNGYCDAGNKYFADLYQVNERTIRSWINQLVKKGYLKSKIVYKTGTKQVIKRKLFINIEPVKENEKEEVNPCGSKDPTLRIKRSDPCGSKDPTPADQKILYNNTSINNTSVSKKEETHPPNFEFFKEDILNRFPAYAKFDLQYYYQRVELYLLQNPKQLTDFTAYAVSFMLGDQTEKKAKLSNKSCELTFLGDRQTIEPEQRKQRFRQHLFNTYIHRYKKSDLDVFYGYFSQIDSNGVLLIEKSKRGLCDTLINAYLKQLHTP